jgi:Nucleotidyl transferase AbiEii toxin, Type IV TA system
LALKGGNALNLLYRIGGRTSVDVDVSISGELDDLRTVAAAILNSVRDSLATIGLVSFDERYEPRPKAGARANDPGWGGYELRFKLTERRDGDIDLLRRTASVIGPSQERTFKIQISKGEFFDGGDLRVDFEGVSVLAYSPAMIAVEKLRAICQQMPEYSERGKKTARARDFYDIHEISEAAHVDLTAKANLVLVRGSFFAKRVPLGLLKELESAREFHRPDWPSVEAAVEGFLDDFDFYFDSVIRIVKGIVTAIERSDARGNA